jgi:hypothetical protein
VLAFEGDEGESGVMRLQVRGGWWAFQADDGVVAGRRVFFGPFSIRASRQMPTAKENRPASVSALACISY